MQLSAWQHAQGLKRQRSADNKAAFAMSKLSDDVKLAIVEGNIDRALVKLGEAIDAGEPWAITTVFQAAGAVGPQPVQVAINAFLVDRFGIANEVELAGYVESGKRMQQLGADLNTDELFDTAMDSLLLCVREKPERLVRALARLQSGAEVVDGSTNGDGSPNVNGGG